MHCCITLLLSVFISPQSQSDDSLYHSIYFAWELYLQPSACLLGTGNYPVFSSTGNTNKHSPYSKFFMFAVKSLICTHNIFQEKLLKEHNPRTKWPLWLLLQLLPPNNRLAGFGMGLSLTPNLLPKWRRGQQSSSKTLDPTPFSGSICGGPWPSPCIWLPCAGQVTAAGTRRRLAVLLCKCHVSAMLCKGLVTFTWLTRYNVMLKMQTLRDSWRITSHYFVLEMEMVSAFEHQFTINVFLKEDKIRQILVLMLILQNTIRGQ